MNKYLFLIFFFLFNGLNAKLDLNRPEAEPNQKLSKLKSFIREFGDFVGLEDMGFQALLPINEKYIRAIIHELDMDDYCIEIRGMSNAAQRAVGRVNAFVLPSVFFTRKSHAYLFISEDWFETLQDQEKQALVRHELMHIKHDHVHKNLRYAFWSALGLGVLEYLITNAIMYRNYPELAQDRTSHIIYKWSFAPRLLILTILMRSYSRYLEKEADLEAAKTMTNKQGMSDLFKEIKDNVEDPVSKFAIKRFFYYLFKPINDLFNTHPELDERIAYIQDLR